MMDLNHSSWRDMMTISLTQNWSVVRPLFPGGGRAAWNLNQLTQIWLKIPVLMIWAKSILKFMMRVISHIQNKDIMLIMKVIRSIALMMESHRPTCLHLHRHGSILRDRHVVLPIFNGYFVSVCMTRMVWKEIEPLIPAHPSSLYLASGMLNITATTIIAVWRSALGLIPAMDGHKVTKSSMKRLMIAA